jgi:two-component system, chemotaxis family, chemotaxis protein CheY
MADRKVLVVDDSATMRQLLIMAVRKLDGIGPLTFVEAVDGKDGYEKFVAGNFDLILSDIKMPNMTGLDLVAKVRQESNNKNVPIIIISTKGEEHEIQAGLTLGANEYLLKPISTIRLKEVITRLLA